MSILCACGCGKELPPRTPGQPGRPRRYLEEHAPDKRAGKRTERRQVTPTIAPVLAMPGAASTPPEPDLVAVTRADLEQAGADRTPEGLIALTLAAQIAAGGGTQAGMAALARQFHASLAEARRAGEDGEDGAASDGVEWGVG
jgi:hypothetical protein